MSAETSAERFYASEKYLLPADKIEAARLDVQHRVFFKAFENRLLLAPIQLKSGDRVLESAAGTGIWALEFLEQNGKNGAILDIECIDISDKQIFQDLPPNIRFSLCSVTDLPAQWSGMFSYVHQRLVVLALDDTLWRKAISELFRVLSPGGWVELAEIELQNHRINVGPSSSKLQSLALKMFPDKGVILKLAEYLLPVLKESGFVDVQCEMRQVRVGSGEQGYSSREMESFLRALKRDAVSAGGYGFIQTEDDYERLLREAESEWDGHLDEAAVSLFTIVARKP
ncbi:hypothetical protein D9757_011860 [Collybiopsis confluens]|uniref:S-adenosyl-L-methionine-dependent methyltransferase n=1 Tax=Collybiopsis confluens TaxID=2823264 RepID=A0A8H5D3W7_9AGAR|nr:hypothetical protein D9757_011860 [Collybiopsis confluens]